MVLREFVTACRLAASPTTRSPVLVKATIDGMIREGLLVKIDHKTACKNFVKAATKGVIKVMSKMGISAVQSYRGAQVFEALGLRQDVVDQYFTWTPSRVGGIGLDVLAQEVLLRHHAAFPGRQVNGHVLPSGGLYQWRNDGEQHLFTPESIHRLQKAVRTGSKVVRVLLRHGKATGEYEDFLTGFVVDNGDVWGRPVGVAVAHDGGR